MDYLAWLRSAVLENLSLTVMKRGSQRDSGESIFHLDEIKTSLGRTSIIDIDDFISKNKTKGSDKDVEEKGVLDSWLLPLNNKEISDKDLRFQDTLLFMISSSYLLFDVFFARQRSLVLLIKKPMKGSKTKSRSFRLKILRVSANSSFHLKFRRKTMILMMNSALIANLIISYCTSWRAPWSTTMTHDQPLKRKSSRMVCHGSLVKLLKQMTLRWTTMMMRLMLMMMRRGGEEDEVEDKDDDEEDGQGKNRSKTSNLN
ncbi:hypothetical protein HID58_047899 [Brassica napus]|uniref:Uncharacterized protein n=1 Tax=Brassica napus TaxID=3708 RepID=A0ABQ8B0M8_BRANA|nr:hypothetical protein HID58_047899 [Brassica napus]